MNVYIWTSGVLKNDYIGEVYEYSYDFRGKTKTQLANDWWVLWSNAACDSNWYYTPDFNTISKFILPFTLSNANKITFSAKYKVIDYAQYSMYVRKENYSHRFGYYLYWHSVCEVLDSISWSRLNFTWDNPVCNLIIDFNNLTWNLECWSITKNWTITQAQANNMKWNNTIWMKVDQSSWSWGRLQTIKLLVE